MLATIKADFEAAKTYVAVHYKQLVAAALTGKYLSAAIAAVTAFIRAL